jgi:DNA-binding LytR/AlgR family response regulator
MRIVILEDELPTARDIERILREIAPDWQLVAMLHSYAAAKTFFERKPNVDLIFSDIDLGDGLSLHLFEQLSLDTPIVFITAFNQYALEAFRSFGIDYLLKPVDRDVVARTVDKIRSLGLSSVQGEQAKLLEYLQRAMQPKDPSIIVHIRDRILPVKGSDIALFAVEHEQVFAYTFAQQKYAASMSMELLEQQFSPVFFRANRQQLINRKAVVEAVPHFNRKLLVRLTIPYQEPILISKEKSPVFLHWLSTY